MGRGCGCSTGVRFLLAGRGSEVPAEATTSASVAVGMGVLLCLEEVVGLTLWLVRKARMSDTNVAIDRYRPSKVRV